MKIYNVNGFLRWYKEGEQPEGAIEVTKDKEAVAEKSVEPKNKSRKASKK